MVLCLHAGMLLAGFPGFAVQIYGFNLFLANKMFGPLSKLSRTQKEIIIASSAAGVGRLSQSCGISYRNFQPNFTARNFVKIL